MGARRAQRNKSLANANVTALKEQQTRGLLSSSCAGGGRTAGCIRRCEKSNARPYHGRFLPALGRCCTRLETSSSCCCIRIPEKGLLTGRERKEQDMAGKGSR